MGHVTRRRGRPTVYVAGSLFLDIVMCGLEHAPRPGEEQWIGGSGVMPGGVANQAVACARLGLNSAVITYLGQDRPGSWVREMLADELVDMSYAEYTPHQNITVSLVMEGDRALTTHGKDEVPIPRDDLPAPDVFLVSLPYLVRAQDRIAQWREQGTIVIADAGWDATGEWPREHLEALAAADVFVPNCSEAMHYTRTLTIPEAAEALTSFVPTVVVTCGAQGVHIAHRSEGSPTAVVVPALEVDAIDTTGAGDAFSAGLATGLATGAPLTDAVHLGQCAAAWTVCRIGGSSAAPHMGELGEWVAQDPRIDALAGQSVRNIQAKLDSVTAL
ncbi:carbohydrate kinase family protein [Flaviflexus equikiangi]|uniref:carbohydrate kinase family protein n=1 Tax=Flaviflexus equikiangi TaxID=2758573 RepID=UPI0015F74657|nr:carbohydrate kinase family protein [Flaviflexus equikiangi]